jgi:hypothetical protein
LRPRRCPSIGANAKNERIRFQRCQEAVAGAAIGARRVASSTYGHPRQIRDEERGEKEGAPHEEPSRRAAPSGVGGEGVIRQHRRRCDCENDGGKVERVRRSETSEPQRGEPCRARPLEISVQEEEREREKEEAERVRSELLRVADVERREREKERGRPSRRAPHPPRQQRADGAYCPEPPGDGKELARPVGGGERFHDPVEQVVERRVNRVELERFPEKRPVPPMK